MRVPSAHGVGKAAKRAQLLGAGWLDSLDRDWLLDCHAVGGDIISKVEGAQVGVTSRTDNRKGSSIPKPNHQQPLRNAYLGLLNITYILSLLWTGPFPFLLAQLGAWSNKQR